MHARRLLQERIQRANRKKHKPFCNMVKGKGEKNGCLAVLTREVLRIVIDAYRLRMETDHVAREEYHSLYWEKGAKLEGLVWVEGDVVEDFQRWLGCC